MAEKKTKKNNKSVGRFLEEVSDERKRADCHTILNLMKKATGEEPAMWGPSIVGFGSYHYRYESGREGDSFLTGFSPRKLNLTLYIIPGFSRFGSLMEKLGKHKTGKCCLYIKRLSDIDIDILEKLIVESVAHIDEKYNR